MQVQANNKAPMVVGSFGLTAEHRSSYLDLGFLFLSKVFSQNEVAVLRSELPAIYADEHPRNHLVPGMVRTVRAPHTSSEALALLYRDPRLVEPARQLLDSDVYLHQFKLNAKLPFSRECAPWHQEFKLWHNADGMREPRALIAGVFLDEVTEFNGPLTFMAGSHNEGFVDRPDDDRVFGPALAWIHYYLDRRTSARLAAKYPFVSPKGPAGSVVFFHCTTVHGSVPSVSPSSRDMALIGYNSVQNALPQVERPRPEYAASRNFEPVVCVEEGALLERADARATACEARF